MSQRFESVGAKMNFNLLLSQIEFYIAAEPNRILTKVLKTDIPNSLSAASSNLIKLHQKRWLSPTGKKVKINKDCEPK